MKTEYENCKPEDAELFRIRGTDFLVKDKKAYFLHPFITLMVESGRCIHIHTSDIQLFGIESLRKKQRIPKEFIATPELVVTSYGDNHGMPYERGYYVLKPDSEVVLFDQSTKYKCVEIIED